MLIDLQSSDEHSIQVLVRWTRALVCSLSRAGFGLVGYPHYRLFVRMTNEYDRARAVFTVILGLALIFLQWLSAFWTINHLQIPISRIGKDYVKLLRISDSDVSSVSANLFPNVQEERKRGVAGEVPKKLGD